MTGDYAKLLPALEKMNIDQFVLENATPRAGDINVVGSALSDRELGGWALLILAQMMLNL